MGDLDDARLTRGIGIVVEGYDLPTTPEASAVFNRAFLPPLAERALVYKTK
ncbi:hypothetical protein [Aureimonas frigidaquae]|uniref:hypothetical protein n=1 Tax=Aureimonas frigidaquae TaxID=424757 RepID=UPI000A624ED2